jgi:uncharacterized repeat protein (TIGR03803 family)
MKRKSTVTFAFVLFLTAGACAATQTTLWNFGSTTGDGASPYTNSLIFDKKGNLYGVTMAGGAYGAGAVFKLSPRTNGSYRETILYSFCSKASCADGYTPYGGLLLDSKGNLYGTTYSGAGCNTYTGICGAVFELSPNGSGGWTETILYGFCEGGGDCTGGVYPLAGLVMDKKGNLYGTTSLGGDYSDASHHSGPSYYGPCVGTGCGAVFELSPSTGGGWTESILYAFTGFGDGKSPYGGLILDPQGNLYGTTALGGATLTGTVFELTPIGDGTWSETVLHSFGGGKDGYSPEYLTLSRTSAGNLYGTTAYGGTNNTGIVWELVYSKTTKTYAEKVLHNFSASGGSPLGGVVLDSTGNVYGTTDTGGAKGLGTVFELSKTTGSWTEAVLHNFTGSNNGANPSGDLLRDSNGNLYGMTYIGGKYNLGTVFRITP